MKTTHPDRWWLPLAALVLAAHPVSHAQKMYRCVIDGRTVYQQTACPAYASDAKPMTSAASAAAASAASAASAAARVQAAASAASSTRR